ncbi:hypothetical protein TRIP_C20912 [Candidatus Zixiibacteriota bacterium]|nr:hypothetical protein TRIP_C20912 [candidate division Zixibacteria bacterium]
MPANDFTSRINFELKRAERYRIFVSLIVFNLAPIFEMATDKAKQEDSAVNGFLSEVGDVIRRSVREIDALSNSGRLKIGLLCPETSRQGAEAAAKRIANLLNSFCSDYFKRPGDFLIPVEISSFPDAAGARSIASYMDEFVDY